VNRPFKPRLKTLSQLAPGRARKIDRHIHQFQIACLELERTRRTNELAAAVARVDGLNLRLVEIEAEIEQRQREMTPLPGHHPPAPQAPAQQPPPKRHLAASRDTRQTLRY